jgi:hypothetical protein
MTLAKFAVRGFLAMGLNSVPGDSLCTTPCAVCLGTVKVT